MKPVLWMDALYRTIKHTDRVGMETIKLSTYNIPLYAIPDGYCIVPKEPTEVMIEAVCKIRFDRIMKAVNDESGERNKEAFVRGIACREEYAALIAAASSAGEEGE